MAVNFDLENLAVLVQRRHNVLKDLEKVSDQLSDAISRQDEVSIEILLNMRQESLIRCEELWVQILEPGQDSEEIAAVLKRLVLSDPDSVETTDLLEKRILDIRRNTRRIIDRLKEQDGIMKKRLMLQKSFLKSKDKS